MTTDKDLEKGNIALLIAAYLTLNTSLNLLNKVSLIGVASFLLAPISSPSIQSDVNAPSDRLFSIALLPHAMRNSYFAFITFAVGSWSLWSGVPSSPHQHPHGL